MDLHPERERRDRAVPGGGTSNFISFTSAATNRLSLCSHIMIYGNLFKNRRTSTGRLIRRSATPKTMRHPKKPTSPAPRTTYKRTINLW